MRAMSLFVGTLAASLAASPSQAGAQAGVSGSAMILYSHAPTLEFGNDSYSGASIALAADLALGGRWVGRVQADVLQASSVTGPNAEAVQSGLALVGSLGYRLRLASVPKLSIDLLGHAGYAQVTYNANGSDFTDYSPQIGVGIAPHFALTSRLGISAFVRILQGSEVDGGTAINRTDAGIGARLIVF